MHSKEYEKVLKTISHPLKEGAHFDQGLGGVAGFFENMRVNTQVRYLILTNVESPRCLTSLGYDQFKCGNGKNSQRFSPTYS